MNWYANNAVILLLLVILVGAFVGAVVWLMGRIGGRLGNGSASALDEHIARKLPFPLGVVAGVSAAVATLNVVSANLSANVLVQTRHLLVVLLVIAGAWGLMRIIRLGLERVGRGRIRFYPAALVTGRVVSVVVYAMALLTILAQYGISITPLLTGLGIAALAVALALQDTMANFFSGLWIQTEQPLAPGHYVRVEGQGVEGFVDHVGWRTTRIRALAGNLVVIPNSKLSQAVVTDFSMPDPTMSVVMSFRFGFDVDPQRIMALLVEEAKAAAVVTPGLLETPAPFAHAGPGVGEYSIGYSLILKVREFADQNTAQTAVITRVWNRLQREGIRMVYPTRINLQADGTEFVPKSFVKVSRGAPKAPEGRDPFEIEAEQAKSDIAARQAVEVAKVKAPTGPTATTVPPTKPAEPVPVIPAKEGQA